MLYRIARPQHDCPYWVKGPMDAMIGEVHWFSQILEQWGAAADGRVQYVFPLSSLERVVPK
jgi:hypothetical protein